MLDKFAYFFTIFSLRHEEGSSEEKSKNCEKNGTNNTFLLDCYRLMTRQIEVFWVSQLNLTLNIKS